MSITHPRFSVPVSEWIKTDSGEKSYFAVDRYFDRIAWESFTTSGFEKLVIRRHQPLEDFIGPLIHAGFILRMFHEPTATPEQIEKSPRLGYLARIPYFLFMLWQKPT
jgi:hypothetical protein